VKSIHFGGFVKLPDTICVLPEQSEKKDVIHIDLLSVDFPQDEEQRQQAVDRTGVLKRRPNADLQRIVDEAAKLFRAPIAAISIIDRNRQWFAARTGIDAEETPRAVSFCAHAIHRPGEPLIVPDARHDPRFSRNPLVMFSPHIRFYAGVPLIDRQGYPLGALCVADMKPRPAQQDMFELSLRAREIEHLIAR
jgi:GAF domain-containing protein